MALPSKQYGLILPQRKGALKAALQRPSVFGDDSDDETSVGESLKREGNKKKMMKQTRLEMQKALDQDSTVYDYDGVYDDIQKQRVESSKKMLGGADKRPKYIHQLMRAVEDRKKEQERREERKIQKEREAEGEQFADKEAYVTSAYKQKLQEQKEEQEKEKRQAQLEAALDVRKQKDLSGFYRHLLNQSVGEELLPDRSADKNPKVSEDGEKTSPPSRHDVVPSSSSDGEERHQKSGFSKPGGSAHPKRHYRQRSPSSGSDGDPERDRGRRRTSHKERERRSDEDGRKDRRREDRRREEDTRRGRDDRHHRRERDSTEDRPKQRKPEQEDKEQEEQKEKKTEKEVKPEEKEANPEEKKKVSEDDDAQKDDEDKDEEKVNKFVKRSTDQTVSSARERYMARQTARTASKSYIEKEED